MKKFAQLILLIGLSFNVLAQNRIELPIKGSSNNYQLINLEEKGALIIHKNKGDLTIKKYGVDLNEIWSGESKINDKSEFIQKVIKGNSIYLLFGNDRLDYFELQKINTQVGVIESYQFKGVRNFDVSEFDVENNFLALGGYVKSEPALLFYELGNPTPKIVTASYKQNTGFQYLGIVEDHVLGIFAIKSRKKSELLLRFFDKEAKMVKELALTPDSNYEFLNGKFFFTEDASFVIGNYGFRNSRTNGVPNSQGLFISNLKDGINVETNYYSFTEFHNFFGFLKERQQEKIKKSIRKKKAKGSELRLMYNLMVEDIIPTEDGIILTAEVFKPEFRNNYNSPYGFGNSGMMYNPYYWGSSYYLRRSLMYNPWLYGNRFNNSSTFDGFRYYQGLVMSVNKDGKLMWDASVPYDYLKSYDQKEILKVKLKGEEVITTHSINGDLRINTFVDGTRIGPEVEKRSDGNGDSKRVRNTENNVGEYWYDHYFLNYGVQKTGLTKNVFFVNKIAY